MYLDVEKKELKQRQALEEAVTSIDANVDGAVVEGRSDRFVLEALGFKSRIFESAERTTEDLAEDLERSVNRVAVLTDFDSHGERIGQEIEHELQGRVDVVRSCRKTLRSEMVEQGRMAVEDAAPLLESKETKFVDALLDRLFMKG